MQKILDEKMEILDQKNELWASRLEKLFAYFEQRLWLKIIVSVVAWVAYFTFFFQYQKTTFLKNSPNWGGYVVYFFFYVASALLFFYVLIPKILFKNKPVLFWSIFFFWFFFVYSYFVTFLFGACNYNLPPKLYKLGFLQDEKLCYQAFQQYGFWVHIKEPYFTFNATLQFSLDFGMLLMFTALFHFVSNYVKDNQLNRLNFELESKYLQQQLNPHFLFNSLNNIYGLVLKKSTKTNQVISQFQSLLNYSFAQSSKKLVLLSEELKYMTDYIALEKIRHGNNIRIAHNLDKLQETPFKITPFILITFIENAFKHGANADINAAYVNIDLHITNNNLRLLVQNSIPENATISNTGGIGLNNAKRRLALLYPNHILKQKQSINYYEIELTIELR